MAERKWYERMSEYEHRKLKELGKLNRMQEQFDEAKLTRPPWMQGQHETPGLFGQNPNFHKYIPQGVTGPHWSDALQADEFNRARESMGKPITTRGIRGGSPSTGTAHPSDIEVLDRYWGEVPNPHWRSFRSQDMPEGLVSPVDNTVVDITAVTPAGQGGDESVSALHPDDMEAVRLLEGVDPAELAGANPVEIAKVAGAGETLEGLWAASEADLVSTEERRKRYKEDMSSIFTKAMMLKVLGGLSGNDGEDMSKMFMQFAFEKMDKNKEFAGEDRLKKIRDKVYYREDPRTGDMIFDAPAFRKEGYERVFAVGGDAKDAEALFGHLQQKKQPTEYDRSDLVAFHRGPMADGGYEENNFRPDEEPPKVSPPWIRGRKPTTPRAHNKAQYIAGLDNRVKEGETPETIIPWIRRQIGVGRRELDRVIDDEASLLVASLRDYANAMRQHSRPASELPAFITAMTKLGITLDEQKDIMAKAGLIAAQ